MEAKVSKAQLEVWTWKEKAYEKIKDLPLDEAIQSIVNGTKQVVQELDLKRRNKSSRG